MPPARTTRHTFHRVVLVPVTPASSRDRGESQVRRYRLARLRCDAGDVAGSALEVWMASPRLEARAVHSCS